MLKSVIKKFLILPAYSKLGRTAALYQTLTLCTLCLSREFPAQKSLIRDFLLIELCKAFTSFPELLCTVPLTTYSRVSCFWPKVSTKLSEELSLRQSIRAKRLRFELLSGQCNPFRAALSRQTHCKSFNRYTHHLGYLFVRSSSCQLRDFQSSYVDSRESILLLLPPLLLLLVLLAES